MITIVDELEPNMQNDERPAMTLVTGEPQPWTVPANTDIHEARWLDAWFANQLANVTALHIYGRPLLALRPTVRADIRAFADEYVELAAGRYAGMLDAVERR